MLTLIRHHFDNVLPHRLPSLPLCRHLVHFRGLVVAVFNIIVIISVVVVVMLVLCLRLFYLLLLLCLVRFLRLPLPLFLHHFSLLRLLGPPTHGAGCGWLPVMRPQTASGDSSRRAKFAANCWQRNVGHAAGTGLRSSPSRLLHIASHIIAIIVRLVIHLSSYRFPFRCFVFRMLVLFSSHTNTTGRNGSISA